MVLGDFVGGGEAEEFYAHGGAASGADDFDIDAIICQADVRLS